MPRVDQLVDKRKADVYPAAARLAAFAETAKKQRWRRPAPAKVIQLPLWRGRTLTERILSAAAFSEMDETLGGPLSETQAQRHNPAEFRINFYIKLLVFERFLLIEIHANIRYLIPTHQM